MAEMHHREAHNVNQFKEREKPGLVVGYTEPRQVSGLERRKAEHIATGPHVHRSPGTSGDSR